MLNSKSYGREAAIIILLNSGAMSWYALVAKDASTLSAVGALIAAPVLAAMGVLGVHKWQAMEKDGKE